MNKMDYTKGPWTLEKTKHKFIIPEIELEWLRSHSSNEAQDEEIKASEYGQKELGNAQLISASPDMYEALKTIIPLLESVIKQSNLPLHGTGAAIINYAKQAIAKAEGK